MSDQEIQEWLSMIGRTTWQQARVIGDLLAHANVDRMTIEDRAVCRRALRQLDAIR